MMNAKNKAGRTKRAAYRIFRTGLLALLAALLTGIFGMSAGQADGDGSYGTTAGETILKVRSQCSGSYIDLYTEWGLSRIEDRTVGGIYFKETVEYHCGFYYLYIYHGDECKVVPWAPAATINKDRAATDERIRITFNDVGEYTIYIEPMCADDINTYWKHDRFLYWERDAKWYVCDSSGCTYGRNLYDHGTLTVYCYGNGRLMETYQLSIDGNQTVYPKTIDGYTIDSSAWVEFDGATGRCNPSSVTFYYTRVETGNGGTDSGWNPGYEQPDPVDPGYSDYGGSDWGYLKQLPGMSWSAYVTNASVEYIKPQCGPGDQYQVFRSMDGKKHLYAPGQIQSAHICFTVGNWDYVQFLYNGSCKYGFFRRGVFTPYNGREGIPEYSLDYEIGGTVVREVNPYNGPGYNCGEYSSCSLGYGDTVYACMETNGWYYCRFYNNHGNNYGYVYLWVPGDAISFW